MSNSVSPLPFVIKKIETEQQAIAFSNFVQANKELKSIDKIHSFLKPIQELLGIVEMDNREVDISSFHEELECENIGFNFLLLKLDDDKSIIFKEFCYPDKIGHFIRQTVDFSEEQKERDKFYKIDCLVKDVYEAQRKLKEAQNILLCHID